MDPFCTVKNPSCGCLNELCSSLHSNHALGRLEETRKAQNVRYLRGCGSRSDGVGGSWSRLPEPRDGPQLKYYNLHGSVKGAINVVNPRYINSTYRDILKFGCITRRSKLRGHNLCKTILRALISWLIGLFAAESDLSL